MTLESVQEFYKIIKQEPKRATRITTNLLEVCNRIGFHELDHQPVITLTKTKNGQVSYHAVVVESFDRSEDYLELKTIDSLSKTGKTSVECSIFDGEVLAIGEFPDQWCLASEKCHYLKLN